jgi:hypothetical protein
MALSLPRYLINGFRQRCFNGKAINGAGKQNQCYQKIDIYYYFGLTRLVIHKLNGFRYIRNRDTNYLRFKYHGLAKFCALELALLRKFKIIMLNFLIFLALWVIKS